MEACEAVAQYWDDIGINVKFQNIPYSTLRPQLVARTYEGATCHSVGSRLGPSQGYGSYLNAGNFSWGAEHPFLEDIIARTQRAVLQADREKLEDEVAAWNIEHVFAETGLYAVDNVWPIGPKLESWEGFIKQGDLRQINGFEYMVPRK